MPIPRRTTAAALGDERRYSEWEPGEALRQAALAELSGTYQAARLHLGRDSIFALR